MVCLCYCFSTGLALYFLQFPGIHVLLLLGKKRQDQGQGLDPGLGHGRGQEEDPGPDQGREVTGGLLELKFFFVRVFLLVVLFSILRILLLYC